MSPSNDSLPFDISTDRLLMRPFNIDDINPFFQICANPEVMRYIDAGTPLDQETVKSQITNWISLYEASIPGSKKEPYGSIEWRQPRKNNTK